MKKKTEKALEMVATKVFVARTTYVCCYVDQKSTELTLGIE